MCSGNSIKTNRILKIKMNQIKLSQPLKTFPIFVSIREALFSASINGEAQCCIKYHSSGSRKAEAKSVIARRTGKLCKLLNKTFSTILALMAISRDKTKSRNSPKLMTLIVIIIINVDGCTI